MPRILTPLRAIVLVAAIAGVAWLVTTRRTSSRTPDPVTLRGSGDVLTIAASGDSLITRTLPLPGRDSGLDSLVGLLTGTSLAVTNLEQALLDGSRTDAPAVTTWPFGSRATAVALRRFGFTVATCANNHAVDHGIDGLRQTTRILDDVGLLHAGCGDDLDAARKPVVLGMAPRRVAVLAIATSVAGEARATAPRGDIAGRPGVSALRYTADVTVDPATFDVLRPLAAATPTANELELAGTRIKRGARTVATFQPDARDEEDLYSRIRVARTVADVVIVTIHSHEPSNHSVSPASFVEQFARKVIDNGASLVIGHGPHQLRGIEVHGNGVILYSLGNFAFHSRSIDYGSADVYERGTDLYQLALGAATNAGVAAQPMPPDPAPWESVVAVATFERGMLTAVRLHPVDLGVGLPSTEQGTPRSASPERAKAILDRLTRLSGAYGTQIRQDAGVGTVDIGVLGFLN